MGDPLHRGSAEGARCNECPFSRDDRPDNPVFSEFPDDPKWIIIGEGPGFNEIRQLRPFVGATGQVVNQILKKIGRPRDHLAMVNATLCMPPTGCPVEVREKAAEACKPRLQAELAMWPGKPILTLGAVAARSIIPKEILDAIDPPDVPKNKKRAQKDKQKAERLENQKKEKTKGRTIEKIAKRRFAEMMKFRRDQLKREVIRRYCRKPDKLYLDRETERDRKPLWVKAWKDAQQEYGQKSKELILAATIKKARRDATKPKKRKPIKITDIVGTLFDVDVDGSGVRPVVPAIHPAALLRGGGATIGGSHTPDMAYINIVYDAAKVDALSKGVDIRLKVNVDIEVVDPEKATRLFVEILQVALEEQACSIDLETYVDDPDRHHALMTYVAKIRVIGISTTKRTVSVLWDLLPSWAMSYFQLVVGSVVTGYHHGLYDRTVLRAYGFVMPIMGVDDNAPNYEDSLLAHHASFPGCSHRLQTVTAQFFGVGPWKAEFRNQDETPEKLAVYNALDTGGTHALIPALAIHVKRTKTEAIYELDKRMADIASRMHLVGMPVSREVNSQLVSTFTRLANEARRVVDDKANDPKIKDAIKHHLAIQLAAKQRKADSKEFEDRYELRLSDLRKADWRFNVNNSKHIAALLQGMGVDLYQMTDKGAISTKKDVLEELANVGIVRDILKERENKKMLDFVGPIFDRSFNGQIVSYGFADEWDRIHPIWSTTKISGRWAGSEPHGISNPPREKVKEVVVGTTLHADTIVVDHLCKHCKEPKDKHSKADHPFEIGFLIYAERPTTKRQFVCRKGRKIVGFDFSQIEARCLAIMSGDPFMCEVFASGKDLHKECARVVFPGFDQKSSKEQKQVRTVCKTLEYATFYGAMDETVWKGLLKEGYDFKLVDVSKSLAILRHKMSGIVKWQRDTILRASQPPYELRDFVLGRRRVWPMGQVEQSQALNIVPQATGSAIMNMGMAKMDQRLPRYKEAYPIVQIHDAAAFECWEEDADDILADINACFPAEFEVGGRTIKFPVEAAIGSSLADV